MNQKRYIVVWQRGTDEDFLVDYMTADKIRAWVKEGHLQDYTIIDGEIIKSAGNSSFDLSKLK